MVIQAIGATSSSVPVLDREPQRSNGVNNMSRESPQGCLRGKKLQSASALAANIISFGFGAAVGWSSAVGPELNAVFSEDEISWIVTATLPLAVTGALCWGSITTRIGPKKSALIVAVPMFIGWCLLLKTTTLWCALLGRGISGLALGGLVSAVPHYISEISEDALRGTLGAIMVLCFNIGTLVIYALGGVLDSFYIAIFGAAIPIIFTIIFFPCPESPVYLLTHGHDQAGRLILEKLRYPQDITNEMASIHSSQSSTNGPEARLADIFTRKAARKAFGLSVGMFGIQQISGIIPVLSYAGKIFDEAGGSFSPVASSCIVAAVQIVGSILGVLLMDKAGRRPLMLFSCFVMACGHGLLAYVLMEQHALPGWVPVLSLSAFMIAYAVGAGAAPYVIMTELCSPSIRAMVSGIVIAFNGLFSFVITKTYSDLVGLIGVSNVFWMYAGGCAAGGFFVMFFLPETSGKSNASIQAKLEGKKDSCAAAKA